MFAGVTQGKAVYRLLFICAVSLRGSKRILFLYSHSWRAGNINRLFNASDSQLVFTVLSYIFCVCFFIEFYGVTLVNKIIVV